MSVEELVAAFQGCAAELYVTRVERDRLLAENAALKAAQEEVRDGGPDNH